VNPELEPELDPDPELEPEDPELDVDDVELGAAAMLTLIDISGPTSTSMSPASIRSRRFSGQPGAEIGVKPSVKSALAGVSVRKPR
jgi:hypothetical protein